MKSNYVNSIFYIYVPTTILSFKINLIFSQNSTIFCIVYNQWNEIKINLKKKFKHLFQNALKKIIYFCTQKMSIYLRMTKIKIVGAFNLKYN